ncbi:zonular occludens toxin domain-containing protein [Nocardia sp. NPDC050697]|uniref:zonular occludens toxin domain-containing protein n=1 Tax=Nocardia sp. NPDC050697 TaxID=3155158 RepID=UPI0033C9A52E
MNEEQYHALASIQFSSALTPDEIWSPLSHHVDGLHPRAAAEIERAVQRAVTQPRRSPTGLVLQGERGVGKTHMLGWLRELVEQQGGAFFMPKLIDGASFWAGAVHGIVARLLAEGGRLGWLLGELAERTGCDAELTMRLRGNLEVQPSHLNDFVGRIEDLDIRVATECSDTLRALVLYRARGPLREIGLSYLTLDDGIEESAKGQWGFRQRGKQSQLLFHDLCRIFALAGPVVLAIDQVDTVIAQSDQNDEDGLANRLADGLMRMREETTRTVIVAACIPKSWDLITKRAVNSAADRFTVLELSTAMPGGDVARAIVERHLGGLYGEIGFEPPHPTWPVLPAAFEHPDIVEYTPRRLLQQLEKHVAHCLAQHTVVELTDFGTVDEPAAAPMPDRADLGTLDARFAALHDSADVIRPLDPRYEDERMVALLNAALQAYVLEQNRGSQELTIDPDRTVAPALHARLRRTLDEASEDEEHWSFRAIAHSHHRAVLARLRSASLEAGIQPNAAKRHLVVLRNSTFSTGPVTTTTLADFEAARGVAVPIAAADLKTFTALETLLAERAPGLAGWLAARRPASRSELFVRIFGEPANGHVPTSFVRTNDTSAAVVPTAPSVAAEPEREPATDEPTVLLGRKTTTGKDLRTPLLQLRKHTTVFAGSGSGKTVLLRRLVEEAALHGVSSILIDTNNDLARLGDGWPTPPPSWLDGDAERARRYLDGTDVVIWTPRRETGNPIALDPLPDFSGVLDDPDEFRIAIDASVAGLLPRTGLTGRRTATGNAVLIQALTRFARDGGSDLTDFVDFLADLPDGVSTLRDSAKLAASIAEELAAATINDPVFGGAGTRLDPGMLLTPRPGKRARVSVISCIGLPVDAQRQTFVNQLQLALFAWIKRNPAGDRPLGGLLVLDEAQTFVPQGRAVVSSQSTLQLAAQARKYGLGMVYATQAPKALDNRVTGNAATQFFGRLNAPVQIQAATELARAKGGQVDDIARLAAGSFYGTTEGAGFAKLAAPMCLSHHPASALTEDEVLARAKTTRP